MLFHTFTGRRLNPTALTEDMEVGPVQEILIHLGSVHNGEKPWPAGWFFPREIAGGEENREI